jgi:hypothetical protein
MLQNLYNSQVLMWLGKKVLAPNGRDQPIGGEVADMRYIYVLLQVSVSLTTLTRITRTDNKMTTHPQLRRNRQHVELC